MSIGGTAEKIVSAFHLMLTEQPNEDEEISKCKSAVHRVRKMEKDVDSACAIGILCSVDLSSALDYDFLLGDI